MPIKGQLELEWEKFHEENPHIYRLVNRFASKAIAAGHEKYSIKSIWELIRWEVKVENKDLNFKMPNNHTAYYARLWLKDNPYNSGFFETCRLRSVEPGKTDRYGRDLDDTI